MDNWQSDDFVAAGFERLDPELIEKRPPKIRWGALYKDRSESDKVVYLEKLAATMNHAAYLIQGERNQLFEMCALKEQQLIKMAESVEKNNAMLQQEVTRMNEQRQGYNRELARLNSQVRELSNGDNN